MKTNLKSLLVPYNIYQSISRTYQHKQIYSENKPKKQIEWMWTDEHTKVLMNLRTCLAHYGSKSTNILTTDASTKYWVQQYFKNKMTES